MCSIITNNILIIKLSCILHNFHWKEGKGSHNILHERGE